MSVATTKAEWLSQLDQIDGDLSVDEKLSLMSDIIKGLPLFGHPASRTTAAFTQPGLGVQTTVEVDYVSWMEENDVVVISSTVDDVWYGGLYAIKAVDRETSEITIQQINSGVVIPSSTAGTTIPSGSLVRVGSAANATTDVETPTNLQVSVSGLTATVTWTNPSDAPDEMLLVYWYSSYDPEGGLGPMTEGERYQWFYSSAKTSHVFTLPKPGWYGFQIWARKDTTWKQFPVDGSLIWDDYEGPALPSSMTIDVSGNLLSADWTPSTDDAEDFLAFEVRRIIHGEGYAADVVWNEVEYLTGKEAVDWEQRMDYQGDYQVRWQARRYVGGWLAKSEWSEWTDFEVALSAPTALSSSISSVLAYYVTFSWSNTETLADGIVLRLYKTADGVESASQVSLPATQASVGMTVSEAGEYTWQVGYRVGSGDMVWSSAATLSRPAPNAPTSLTAEVRGDLVDTTEVSWTSPVAIAGMPISYLQLQHSDDLLTWANVPDGAPILPSATSVLINFTDYTGYFRIASVDVRGNFSAWSGVFDFGATLEP